MKMAAITFAMIVNACRFNDEVAGRIHSVLFLESDAVSADAVASAAALSAETRLWILCCTILPDSLLESLAGHFAQLTTAQALEDQTAADAALAEYRRVVELMRANDNARVDLASRHRAEGCPGYSREDWLANCPREDATAVREILRLEGEYFQSVLNAKERMDDAAAKASRSAGEVKNTKALLADRFWNTPATRAYNCARYSPLTWQESLSVAAAAITAP